MKRLIVICLVVGTILAVSGTARATWYTFQFSEEDLWNHTLSSDTALYSQDAPRRHHTDWKNNVQTTDSGQPNISEYQRQIGKGTNGFSQTATYDSWLNVAGGGPVDNYGNEFGICDVQLWGANFANAKYAWGERFKIADTGAAAWQILAVPEEWTAEILQNPWPDPGYANDMYFIDWSANSYEDRILYSESGDSEEEYLFEFAVDIVGEYPSALENSPDGNPFENDGSLRIWFGGYLLNPNNEWTNEGFDGVIPEPATIALLCLGSLSLIRTKK